MKDNKIYNTALYCRLSLDDGSVGESGSIQTQKIILEEYAKNLIEEKWFYLAPEMASGVTSGTVTLTLTPACRGCKLDVFSSTAGTEDVLLASNDGSGTVKFTATQGKTYYIRVKGAYTITFQSAFTPA